MIYRIDIQHFLSHAIDHFTLKDIISFEYCIISAKVTNGGKLQNVVKMNDLYPSPDIVTTYYETKDKKLLKKMYAGMLSGDDVDMPRSKKDINPYTVQIYQTFVNPLLHRYNICIICDEAENDFIDVLCDYLKEEFHIEVIDLNTLFKEGKIGSIYIDRDDIRDRAVDIRQMAAKEQAKALATTRDGKQRLIEMMTTSKKKKELKRLGINPEDIDKKDLNKVLFEEWCREDGQWDED